MTPFETSARATRSRRPETGEVPLFDLRLSEQDIDAVTNALRSGWLTMGPRTQALEEAFAAHLGVRHAVALSSGTAALHLAYLVAGIGAGDEVIMPSYTFVATAAAAIYCGAAPVFADIAGDHDLSLDPEEVRRCLSPRTRAIVGVHFAGYPAAVDQLAEICAREGLALVEDAAHAPGGTLHGRALGSWGRVAAFSLFSNKVLPVGEGGLLATDEDELARRARSLRSHAMSSGTWDRHRGHAPGYDVHEVGFNYRIDEPRSALAHSRLQRLEAEISCRRELTRNYRDRLRDHPGLILPYSDDAVADSCCYVMPILLRDGSRREQIREALLTRHGIQTSVHYPPVHRLAAYRGRYRGASLTRTEAAARREITIPLFSHMSEEQLDRVVHALELEVEG